MGLDIVELVMAIEEEFGIEIPNPDAAKLDTVGKISAYVQSRLELNRGRPFDEIEEAVHWERIKRIVVEQLGIDPKQVTREAHLVLDLGAD
ncbi:phosphopantetheine-binding protein [Steroidobacter flavus]|uniref:Phosphopantetheine-binding protein n=1 Tax=Steroidobacter flavus TaxID=1842136 RepID=A0ABV8SWJ4_9GAMM